MENSFAEKIVELKLLTDRWCEGQNKSNGLFLVSYQFLYELSKAEFVAPKVLIKKLGLAKSNLALVAKEMIKKGFAISKKDEQNRREIYYSITDSGKKELNAKLEQIETGVTTKQKDQEEIIEKAIKVLEMV